MTGGSSGQAGYYYQNLVAANHLLDLIEIGTRTRSVTLEAAESARHVDDIIVERPELTHFIQVKWSEDEKTSLTLASLTAQDGSSRVTGKSLMQKLAIGFAQASDQGRHDVRITLVSTWNAGTQRRPSLGWDRSLVDFLEGFHKPFIAHDQWQLTTDHEAFDEYQNVVTKLQAAAGLDGDVERFSRLLKSLTFELGQPARDTYRVQLQGRLLLLGISATRLPRLLDAAVRWSIEQKTIRARDVIGELGLDSAFGASLVQSFPVDEAGWVNRPEVHGALDASLSAVNGGYILVEGEAGIGKSTSVSQHLRDRDDIAFAYYCYVPDEQSLGNERLTEAAFLSSLCEGLRTGFPDVSLPRPYATPSIGLLNDWLRAITEENERVVLIVDGLDHVSRKVGEGLLTRPLSAVLDGVPPTGVTLIVTARAIDVLPTSVREQVSSDPRRRIVLPPLNPGQVDEFFALRGIDLSAEELDQAVRASAGLPVYLEVIARTIAELEGYARETALSNLTELGDEGIERFHRSLWKDVASHPLKRRLLAVLSRRGEAATIEALHSTLGHLGVDTDRASVETALRELGPIMRVVETGEVALLHASLGEYIRRNTGDLDSQISSALLEYYESEAGFEEGWRHSFRHMMALGIYSGVLERCTSDWLERAWIAHRPLNEINANLAIALECAERANDLSEFVRLSLLWTQLALVEDNLGLSPDEEAALLLDIGQPELALRRVWSGQYRTCGALDFARFCRRYEKSAGHPVPSRIVHLCLADVQAVGWSASELSILYSALSSAVDPLKLLARAEATTWTEAYEDDQPGAVALIDDAELTQRVIRGLIERAIEARDLGALDRAAASTDLTRPSRSLAAAGRTIVFHRAGEVTAALAATEDINLEGLSHESRRWLALSLGQLGLVESAPSPPSETPTLPEDLLAPSYGSLSEGLLQLWPELRWVYMTGDDTREAWVQTSAAALDSPLSEVVTVLSQAAQLWAAHARGHPDPEAARKVRTLLIALGKAIALSTGNEESVTRIFRREADPLFNQVWQCAHFVLGDSEYLELVEWWAATPEAVRHGEVTTGLARLIAERFGSESAPRDLLLDALEKRARLDQDAEVMSARLASCAAIAGCFGKDADVENIWLEVFDAARGVAWKKDYQFNEILVPLRQLRGEAESLMLRRVKDQLALACRLSHAARQRTSAVAIQGLVEFIAQHDAGLALVALTELDAFVSRSEALPDVLRALQKTGFDCRLRSALLGTMEKWSDFRGFDDHTKPALMSHLRACIATGDLPEAERLYRTWRPTLLVETATPETVGEIARLWIDGALGLPPDLRADASLDTPPTDTHTATPSTSGPQDEIAESLDGGQADPHTISEIVSRLDLNERARSRRERLGRSLPTILDSVAQLLEAEDDGGTVVNSFEQRLRHLLVESTETPPLAGLRELLDRELREIQSTSGRDYSTLGLDEFIDVDAWCADLASTNGSTYWIDSALEVRIGEWIADAQFALLDDWIRLARNRSERVASRGLLAAAARLAAVDPRRSGELLSEAIDGNGAEISLSTRGIQDVAEVSLLLGPDRVPVTMMALHRQHQQQYPRLAIYSLTTVLEQLVDLPGHPAEEIYGHFADHNRVLAAGLSEDEPDLAWFIPSVAHSDTDVVLRYLIQLLSYPVVDVRVLALRETFDLARERQDIRDELLRRWPELSSGVQEYLLVAFHALGELSLLTEDDLAALLRAADTLCHQNIRAGVRDVSATLQRNGVTMSRAIRTAAEGLVSTPPLAVERAERAALQDVSLPPYLAWVITNLSDASGYPLRERVMGLLPGLCNDVAGAPGQELATHRRHNINSNFDAIEIGGEFDTAVRQAVNEAIRRGVEERRIDPALALEYSLDLRVLDPTDLLANPLPDPTPDRWMGDDLSDEQFLDFADLDNHVQAMSAGDLGWSTLFEHSERRRGHQVSGSENRVTKARVLTWFRPNGLGDPSEHDVENEVELGLLRFVPGLYREELVSIDAAERPEMVPLTVHSVRSFRGRLRPSLASLNRRLARDLERRPERDRFAYAKDREVVVRSSEWQGPFDQGRRRHEPRSSGFVLEARRTWVATTEESLDCSLWAYVSLARTTDSYTPESMMNWSTISTIARL